MFRFLNHDLFLIPTSSFQIYFEVHCAGDLAENVGVVIVASEDFLMYPSGEGGDRNAGVCVTCPADASSLVHHRAFPSVPPLANSGWKTSAIMHNTTAICFFKTSLLVGFWYLKP